MYPKVSNGKLGVGLGCKHPLPAEPTDALPGSEEKIRVLEARAERGEQLFHPLDRRPKWGGGLEKAILALVEQDDSDEIEDDPLTHEPRR